MPSTPVVSNTSPLINLVGVGCLDLLPQLYSDIWIPDLVLSEYRANMAAGDPDLRIIPWLMVQPVAPDPSLRALRTLGVGAAAVITLAQASNARLVRSRQPRGWCAIRTTVDWRRVRSWWLR